MIATSTSNQQGKVVQVIGPTVDVKFEGPGLPEINTALTLSNPAIDATPDKDLDNPGPEEMRQYAPTVGSVLLLLGSHWLMHAGQFVPIRRKRRAAAGTGLRPGWRRRDWAP